MRKIAEKFGKICFRPLLVLFSSATAINLLINGTKNETQFYSFSGAISALSLEIYEFNLQVPFEDVISYTGEAHLGSCYYVAWTGVALFIMAAIATMMSLVTVWK